MLNFNILSHLGRCYFFLRKLLYIVLYIIKSTSKNFDIIIIHDVILDENIGSFILQNGQLFVPQVERLLLPLLQSHRLEKHSRNECSQC